jgi:hypothetical protein
METFQQGTGYPSARNKIVAASLYPFHLLMIFNSFSSQSGHCNKFVSSTFECASAFRHPIKLVCTSKSSNSANAFCLALLGQCGEIGSVDPGFAIMIVNRNRPSKTLC